MTIRVLIMLFFLSLATTPMAAQVNPQQGYVITNEGDTIHGTVDYLTDASNARACLFRKAGEDAYKSLSPTDIKSYRLAGDGIYYVSRPFTDGEHRARLFAEFLLQGGVSLYRYYYDGYNYFGFEDSDGKEVIIRDDKLNEDLLTYNDKLQKRRQKVQDVNALMNRDNTIASRLWKMDLTSSELTRMVKQYDEQFCTDLGECIVFQYDKEKATAVIRRFYVGAGLSYASYKTLTDGNRVNVTHAVFSGNSYAGIAPTFLAGVDFLFPRFSRSLTAQLELSYTPHRYHASEEILEGGNPKMILNELAARLGVSHVFRPESRVRPFIRGGIHFSWNSGMKEKDVCYRYGEQYYDQYIVSNRIGDLEHLSEARGGVYLGAGVDICRVRISASWKKAWGGKNGLAESACGLLTASWLF